MSTDPNTPAVVLHFGIVPLGRHDVAQIDRYTDPNVEHVVSRWGRLTAVVAGTWDAWGTDPSDPRPEDSLHVSVDLSATHLDLVTLPELVADIRMWVASLVPEDSARLLDYAVVTEPVWSEGARVVTTHSSGPNVWGGPAHWTDQIDHGRRAGARAGAALAYVSAEEDARLLRKHA